MLPKKTFTMSYILKHAISKQKSHDITCLSRKKLQMSEKSQFSSKLIGNFPHEPLQNPPFSTAVGDLFLFSEEIERVPFFGFLSQIKRVVCFIWNKAFETIEYALDEHNSIESNLNYKEKKNVDCKENANSQNAISLHQRLTQLIDNLFVELNQEKKTADKLKSSFGEESRKNLKKNENFAFFIEFEIQPYSLKIKKIAFSQKLMGFFYSSKEKDLEKAVRCDQLPDCFQMTTENYYELMDFLLIQGEREKEINTEILNCYDAKFQSKAKFTKKLFSDKETNKVYVILEGLLEIFDAPNLESNNNYNKKNNLTPSIFKQNWTEFIDRYYIPVKTNAIPKENPLDDRKRCLYKAIE